MDVVERSEPTRDDGGIDQSPILYPWTMPALRPQPLLLSVLTGSKVVSQDGLPRASRLARAERDALLVIGFRDVQYPDPIVSLVRSGASVVEPDVNPSPRAP